MATKHPVYDTDAHFSINPNTRMLKCEGAAKSNVIQYDHNSERMTFELPRYVDGHDMSLCNVVEVHYNNIDARSKAQNQGVYQVDDLQVSPEDPNVVVCSWLISRNATEYVGSLNFLIRFSCTEANGTMNYAWNTAIYSGVQVANGIYNSEVVVEEYTDVLEAWRRSLVNLKVDGETLIIQGIGAERQLYYLDPITGSDPKYIKDTNFDLNDLYKPSQCGVYTIDWQTIQNYKIDNLPRFDGLAGAVKLIVEADYNDDTNPTVFQTVKLRTNSTTLGNEILMWTRQFDSANWSEWQKFVSEGELTTGNLVPYRSLNADKADKADEATYDVSGKPLDEKLNAGENSLYASGIAPSQADGYTEVTQQAGKYYVSPGMISFFIRGSSTSIDDLISEQVLVDLIDCDEMHSSSFLLTTRYVNEIGYTYKPCRLAFKKINASTVEVTLEMFYHNPDPESNGWTLLKYDADFSGMKLYCKYLAWY